MCQPVKNWLSVLREYTRELITFGGFILCIFVYLDFRELSQSMAQQMAQTNEILRGMETRMQTLENWHAFEERQQVLNSKNTTIYDD